MRNRGEIMPELAEILWRIADRIDAGTLDRRDAAILRRLARQAAGEDRDYAVKVHRTRGQKAKGGLGVDQRFALARMVKAHRDKHGGTLDNAYSALSGTFSAGPATIKKAWQEMRPFLNMDEKSQKIVLFFKRRQASSDQAAAQKVRPQKR